MIAILLAAVLGDCPVDVKFNDGSRVLMTIKQPEVVLETRYGKLKIPCNEIDSVEFGVRYDAVTLAVMQKATAALGAASHRDREDATKTMLGLGHMAHRFLSNKKDYGELEAKKRADQIIKAIAESTPRELLERKDEDVVVTKAFTVSGKVIGDEIEAESRLFGKQPIKLSEATSILSMSSAQKTITMEPLDDTWLNTGVKVRRRREFSVEAYGQVDMYPQTPGQYMAGPKGYTSNGKNSSYAAGALVAKIGENGPSFYVGDRLKTSSADEGDLYLMIVRSPWDGGSAGSYNVKISVRE